MNGALESIETQWKINVPLAARLRNLVFLCKIFFFVFYIIFKINIDYCISLKILTDWSL